MKQQDVPKIDAHAHLFYDRDFLIPLLEHWNMKAMVINTSAKSLEGSTPQRWEAMVNMRNAYPERVVLCTTFDPEPIAEPEFASRSVEQLRKHVEEGAVMVKVWKNIGLEVKDRDGSYIQIDDPRFQLIWDYLVQAGVPVVAHIAEPKAAWRALDEASPHYKYYRDNPQYHFYNQPETPDWDTIIQARDRWIQNNPNLTVIGAHLGSMAYDIGEVARRLDRYPNFYVDTAERFGDLATQPSDKVREFFIAYHDRILYGTDMLIEQARFDVSEERRRDECADYRERIESEWQYLTCDRIIEATFRKFSKPIQVQALNLPPEVIQEIYSRNIYHWLQDSFCT